MLCYKHSIFSPELLLRGVYFFLQINLLMDLATTRTVCDHSTFPRFQGGKEINWKVSSWLQTFEDGPYWNVRVICDSIWNVPLSTVKLKVAAGVNSHAAGFTLYTLYQSFSLLPGLNRYDQHDGILTSSSTVNLQPPKLKLRCKVLCWYICASILWNREWFLKVVPLPGVNELEEGENIDWFLKGVEELHLTDKLMSLR